MKEAEALAAVAAEKMVSSGECPYLYYVDMSDRSRPGEFVFFGDCSDGADDEQRPNRIYVSESQLQSDERIRSQAELAWDHSKAYAACRNLILVSVSNPSETDIHDLMGKSVREIETTHRVVVRLDFDAKNDLGLESNYTAMCYFDPGAPMGFIEISNRE